MNEHSGNSCRDAVPSRLVSPLVEIQPMVNLRHTRQWIGPTLSGVAVLSSH